MDSSRLLILFATAATVIHQTCSQSGFNYRTCKVNWNDIGCSIGFHRQLTILQDDRKPNAAVKINWDNLKGYRHDLRCRCHDKAKAAGYSWFAIENTGICLSRKGFLVDYLKSDPKSDPKSINCTGIMTQTPQRAPDGSQCILGGYRVYFNEIKKNIGGDNPGEGEATAPPEAEATAPPEAEATAPPEPTAKACTKISDLCLIIDSSGSISRESYKLVRKFIQKFLDRYKFGEGHQSRVAIITYGDGCHHQLKWTKSSGMTLDQLRILVDSIPYDGGSTRTDLALKCAAEMITEQQRANIKKTVCVMTDGKSWNGKKLLPPVAKALRDIPNVTMVGIGIGDEVDDAELERITGKKINFRLNNFKDLLDKAASTLNDIIASTCV